MPLQADSSILRSPGMLAPTEKRSHRRFPLVLETRLKGPELGPETISSETLDVSAGGVCLRTARPLAVGDPVQFLLRFGTELTMTTPPLLVRFWGTVVRTSPSSELIGFSQTIAVRIDRYEFGASES